MGKGHPLDNIYFAHIRTMDWQDHIVTYKNVLLGKPTREQGFLWNMLLGSLYKDGQSSKFLRIIQGYPTTALKQFLRTYTIVCRMVSLSVLLKRQHSEAPC